MEYRYREKSSQPIREREMLYRLIMSQLRYDGYETAAAALAPIISSYPPTAPSSRLSHLVQLGIRAEGDVASNPEMADLVPHTRGAGAVDLDFESDEAITAPPAHKHEVGYVTSHKGPALVATFSHDGRLAATGSADASIKLLDVEQMLSKTALGHQQDVRPVIRTLYDHSAPVAALDFHPTVSVLASGSRDCSVKFFDYSKPSVKRSYQAIPEVAGVRCLAFHPSGEYMLVGTEHSTLRLYDAKTLQCFVTSDSRDQHQAALTSVHYSMDGRLYASSSKDGSIKVWDGVSNRCIATFQEAHNKQPVSTVRVSKNTKYILSSGKDGNAALWELSADLLRKKVWQPNYSTVCFSVFLTHSGRPLNTYQPPKAGNTTYRTCAVFTHTEDYVIMGGDKNQQQQVLCWETRTTHPHTPLVTGHLGTIRWLAHHPSAPAFITCSEDNRIRFFCHKEH